MTPRTTGTFRPAIRIRIAGPDLIDASTTSAEEPTLAAMRTAIARILRSATDRGDACREVVITE